MGIVDAHPTPSRSRAAITELVAGRKLHFVCLTHPHEDHGRDLVPILESHPEVEEFWHTNSDIAPFVFRLQEMTNWPSEVQTVAREIAGGWANFHIDLYGAVAERDIPIHQVRAGDEPRNYDGVVVHALAPEEGVQQKFLQFWLNRAGDPTSKRPNPNLLSAVLALQWGESVVLLGADALKPAWTTAVARYRKLALPKAVVLKVPHHGAANALELDRNARRPSYLDICHHAETHCRAVLFAGDTKHPHERVHERLHARTELHCLINGRCGQYPDDKLALELEGAKPVSTIQHCQPVVSFELYQDGHVSTKAGHSCADCLFHQRSG